MKKLFLFSIAAAFAFTSCKKETVTAEHEGAATLTFDAKVGSEDFALNKSFTIDSKTYNFSHLRYWVSNVVLVKANGDEFKVPSSYYLVEETSPQSVQDGSFEYPATKRENIEIKNVPVGEYSKIKYSIGVDDKYNDNLSLQAGELSQMNGMTNISWMWHTTYIFSTLGGTVAAGADPVDFKVETGLNTNYKTVSLDLPAAIKISSEKSTAIGVNVDVAKILDGIDVMATPNIGADQPSEMGMVAGNYATKIFSVTSAK